MKKQLIIGHLFPDLLNLYGDLGNIISLTKRAEWRGIKVFIKEYNIGDFVDFSKLDIIILGGGSDREQKIVCDYLRKLKKIFFNYIENDGVLLAICGGYQLLGKYYQTKDDEIQGLEILNLYTKQSNNRLIGNICIQSDIINKNLIIGFENHSGKTYHSYKPLGIVKKGFGNNGEDGKEGLIYKNIVATYLHGPILPKNPELSDYLLQKAIIKKYKKNNLIKLNDNIEIKAKTYMINRFQKGDF